MKKEISQQAACAAAIRKELKAKYPSVKFRVRSEIFAGGNLVGISWNLGPVTKDVDKITDKYAYGKFNSMEDIYEYNGGKVIIPQAKYVSTSRACQTQQELDQAKIGWRGAGYHDLRDEGKTLRHIIAKDVCKLFNFPYKSLDTDLVPEGYHHLTKGSGCQATLLIMVNTVLCRTTLMTGYHGVRFEKSESGKDIINSFEIY